MIITFQYPDLGSWDCNAVRVSGGSGINQTADD
jgi:hypothetical protein